MNIITNSSLKKVICYAKIFVIIKCYLWKCLLVIVAKDINLNKAIYLLIKSISHWQINQTFNVIKFYLGQSKHFFKFNINNMILLIDVVYDLVYNEIKYIHKCMCISVF